MSDITVIGLGLMGAALARAIQRAGHDLTVWNRSPARIQPFIDDGVPAAPDLASAIAVSPIIVICIDNYPVTDALLQSDGIPALLAGKTMVQLSTGTPREAVAAANWMAAQGASYLDGAILCGPDDIATDEAQILLGGETAAHDRAGPLLACLGGTVRYLGPNVRAASALDLAWLTTCHTRFLGLIHAAKICMAEQVSLENFIDLFPEKPDYQSYTRVIHEQGFDEATATLGVWYASLKRVQQQGFGAGISTKIPDFAASFYEKAVDEGYGEGNVMSLFKVL